MKIILWIAAFVLFFLFFVTWKAGAADLRLNRIEHAFKAHTLQVKKCPDEPQPCEWTTIHRTGPTTWGGMDFNNDSCWTIPYSCGKDCASWINCHDFMGSGGNHLDSDRYRIVE
jgi:hypothetical protein